MALMSRYGNDRDPDSAEIRRGN